MINDGVITVQTGDLLRSFAHPDKNMSALFEKMTENVVSAYHLPYSIAPGFLVNGNTYAIPMVTEESSVVAAASWSARYWAKRGGFNARVIADTKIGQIHFTWHGNPDALKSVSGKIFDQLKSSAAHLTERMEGRGGGITGFELIDFTGSIEYLYQIRASFRTADSMGANFINSCLETMAGVLEDSIYNALGEEHPVEIIMSILSNHTPDCRVEATLECDINHLTDIKGADSPADFARKFALAVQIARLDTYRAVTHNKGIFNGIDAVLIATSNDFRAVEAAGHAFASQSGHYTSLTRISLDGGIFRYTLEVPMALGTVGGLTRAHPMAEVSLGILGNPGARELMQLAASAGLANNFAALKSLITTGIQSGHMPLHQLKQGM